LKLLEVIGFVANRELGVSYLHKVHEFGGIRGIIIIIIFWNEKNFFFNFRIN